MAAKNDITGASIVSKSSTKQYEDNYDKIFRKNKVEESKDSPQPNEENTEYPPKRRE
jgi:hypothetical protein